VEGLPDDAYGMGGDGGVSAMALRLPSGSRPLWAVHSYGMRNFDLQPPPDHFLALYTHQGGGWVELARVEFAWDEGDARVAPPDYVAEDGVTQVMIEPSRTWLHLEGGIGAHGGVFNLLSYDGENLEVALAGSSVSPGASRILDVNADGRPDVVVNASDRYVFCYACNVTKIMFAVHTWDDAAEQMVEAPLQEMPAEMEASPGARENDEAVALARGGLWRDAMSAIAEAKRASSGPQPVIDWNHGIIKLHADAMLEHTRDSGYPLLAHVFYGDYEGAVDLMRRYSADALFTPASPLVKETIAEQWLTELSQSIVESATAALQVQPDLASAYFLRGWARYIVDPTRNAGEARADAEKAASLAPDDPWLAAAAAHLSGPRPSPTPLVRRLQFAPGTTAAQVQGQVRAGGNVDYILRAAQGQWLIVTVTSTSTDVVLAVTGARDGRPYLRSASGTTSWRGLLTTTQDYTIQVVSRGSAAPFSLQVTIPARISFAPGASSATVDGRLAARETDEYVLRAVRGQAMTVSVSSPRNDVVLEVYGLEDGRSLGRTSVSERSWTGTLHATQDYGIKATSEGAATAYTLEVRIE
jgi:hypothetical protein